MMGSPLPPSSNNFAFLKGKCPLVDETFFHLLILMNIDKLVSFCVSFQRKTPPLCNISSKCSLFRRSWSQAKVALFSQLLISWFVTIFDKEKYGLIPKIKSLLRSKVNMKFTREFSRLAKPEHFLFSQIHIIPREKSQCPPVMLWNIWPDF